MNNWKSCTNISPKPSPKARSISISCAPRWATWAGKAAAARGIATPLQVPLVANTAAYNPHTFNYFSFREGAGIDFLYVWSWYGAPLDLEKHPFRYMVVNRAAKTEIEAWDQEGIGQALVFLQHHRPLPDAPAQLHLDEKLDMIQASGILNPHPHIHSNSPSRSIQ